MAEETHVTAHNNMAEEAHVNVRKNITEKCMLMSHKSIDGETHVNELQKHDWMTC